MLKVVQLLNSEQKGYIIGLAKFVYIAFNIRDTFMASRRCILLLIVMFAVSRVLLGYLIFHIRYDPRTKWVVHIYL